MYIHLHIKRDLPHTSHSFQLIWYNCGRIFYTPNIFFLIFSLVLLTHICARSHTNTHIRTHARTYASTHTQHTHNHVYNMRVQNDPVCGATACMYIFVLCLLFARWPRPPAFDLSASRTNKMRVVLNDLLLQQRRRRSRRRRRWRAGERKRLVDG